MKFQYHKGFDESHETRISQSRKILFGVSARIQEQRSNLDHILLPLLTRYRKIKRNKKQVYRELLNCNQNIFHVISPDPLDSRLIIKYSEENISEYDKEMTKSLTEMNLENFKVGWYQISFKLDNFVSYETFENQLNSIMEIPFFIYLAYDLLEAESGNPAPFKAYQLNEDFVKMANKKIKVEDLKQYTSKYDKVFTQVPIEIMSNPMNQLFFETYRTEMKQKYTSSVKNVQTFDTTHLMEKNSYCLYDAIEDQLQITNQINEPFFNKKNFPGVDQYVESIDVIDNIQSLQRLNNFTERIKNHGKFIQDSSTLLKKIVD